VAVGYERIRGLRERGQRRDGTFEVGKSKVYPVPVAELWTGLPALQGMARRREAAHEHGHEAQGHAHALVRWHAGRGDVRAKGAAKSQVTLQHRKLASRAEAARMRAFWGGCLGRLGALIGAPEPRRKVSPRG
jgi:hypothetical protein